MKSTKENHLETGKTCQHQALHCKKGGLSTQSILRQTNIQGGHFKEVFVVIFKA